MKDNSYSKTLSTTKQSFLAKFKQTSDNQEKFPFLFRTNPNIYSPEPQIPDTFLKSLNKFDKNSCFIISTSKLNTILEPNILENSIVENTYEEIKSNQKNTLSVNKLDVEDLFSSSNPKDPNLNNTSNNANNDSQNSNNGTNNNSSNKKGEKSSKKEKKSITIDVFAYDFDTKLHVGRSSKPKIVEGSVNANANSNQEQKQVQDTQNITKESLTSSENLAKPDLMNNNPTVSNPTNTNPKNKFNSNDSNTNEKLPGAKLFNEDNLVKKYFLVLKNEFNYGPYNTTELFLFLTHLSKKTNEDKFDFLIVDAMTDVFYNPPDLLEILKDRLNTNEKKFVIEQEIVRATTTMNVKPIFVSTKMQGNNNGQYIYNLGQNENQNYTEERHLEPREEMKVSSKFDKVKHNPPRVYERKLKQPNTIVPKYDIPYFHEKFAGAEYLPLNIFKNDPNVEKAFKHIQQTNQRQGNGQMGRVNRNPNYTNNNQVIKGQISPKYQARDFMSIATPTSNYGATPKGFGHGMFGNVPKSPMFFNDVTPKSVIHFNFNQNTPKNFLQSPTNMNKYDFHNYFGDSVSPKGSVGGPTPTYSKMKKTDLHNKFQNLATVDEKQLTNITDSIFD